MQTDNMRLVIDLITQANSQRTYQNLAQRIHKLFEEIGELSEAYLCVYSDQSNRQKIKTWDDIREETSDVLIVAVDVAVTPGVALHETLNLDHLSSHSYDRLIWALAASASAVGEQLDDRQSGGHAEAMVRYAFALTDLMFRSDDDAVVSEVRRKLAKWRLSQERDLRTCCRP